MLKSFKKALLLFFVFTLTFTVVPKGVVYASSYKLSNTKLTLYVGDVKQLKVKTNNKIKVTWSSSNKKIATVSKTGKVRAKKAGSVIITAKMNKTMKLTCKVTVKKLTTKKKAERLTKQYDNEIADILKYTNEYRAEKGLSSLKLDAEMTKAACYRSLEMANTGVLSHTRPNGTMCFTIFDYYRIKTKGNRSENVAYITGEPLDSIYVCEMWYNSKDHRANMLTSDYTRIGIGIAYKNNKTFYTQLFAK